MRIAHSMVFGIWFTFSIVLFCFHVFLGQISGKSSNFNWIIQSMIIRLLFFFFFFFIMMKVNIAAKSLFTVFFLLRKVNYLASTCCDSIIFGAKCSWAMNSWYSRNSSHYKTLIANFTSNTSKTDLKNRNGSKHLIMRFQFDLGFEDIFSEPVISKTRILCVLKWRSHCLIISTSTSIVVTVSFRKFHLFCKINKKSIAYFAWSKSSTVVSNF